MGKKKIYAVKKGKRTGLFTSWEACQASVEGYPGAEFKGFATEEEARSYLEGISGTDGGALAAAGYSQGQLTAYVDGSFDVRLGRYSFGCVLLLPSGEILRESGSGDAAQRDRRDAGSDVCGQVVRQKRLSGLEALL